MPSVTYQIDLNVGVGQSKVDLAKLDISGGTINGGVATSELYLPGKGQYHLTIDGGVGTIRLYVPSTLAVRAQVNGGLGSFNRLPSMQQVRDDVYETPGFSSAENAVTLTINGVTAAGGAGVCIWLPGICGIVQRNCRFGETG